MINKISLYLLFLLLKYIYSSPCTEKTELSEGEPENICESLSTVDDNTNTSCVYDTETKGCKEVTCSSLPYGECSKFHYKQEIKMCYQNFKKKKCELKACADFKVYNCEEFKSSDNSKRCLPNEDNTACKLQTCEELKKDCHKFINRDPNEMCVENEDFDGCHTWRCTDMNKNCKTFQHPLFPQYLCIDKGNVGQCVLKVRDCAEMAKDTCYLYGLYDERKYRCIYNPKKMPLPKCEKKFCEDLVNEECDTYLVPFDWGEKCLPNPDGEKCILKSCANLTVEECPTFIFDNNNFKCDASSGKCQLTKCTDLDGENCGNFVPNNPLFKCIKNELNGKCYIEEKTCEELPVDMCDKIDVSPKKCVLSKNQTNCELED